MGKGFQQQAPNCHSWHQEQRSIDHTLRPGFRSRAYLVPTQPRPWRWPNPDFNFLALLICRLHPLHQMRFPFGILSRVRCQDLVWVGSIEYHDEVCLVSSERLVVGLRDQQREWVERAGIWRFWVEEAAWCPYAGNDFIHLEIAQRSLVLFRLSELRK